MTHPNRFLTGILLVLIGVLAGGAFVMMQQGYFLRDHSSVRFTEVKKSEKPLFSDDELAKLDARFLFKNVADHVIPTVVYISTIVSLDDAHQGSANGDDSFWDRFRAHRARTIGSGVIVSENGYIVTNNHVIHGAINGRVSVILNDKRVYDARIVGTDPTTDLAILKIDAVHLPAITIGNSNKVNVGEWVLAVGNPFRLRSTVTAGIVSALSRQVQISGESDSRLKIDSFIQTDAAINKGNSGGALVNTSGELVGINTAIASQTGNYQGYGFAVPSNLVRKVMRDLIEFGQVHRAMLGVSIVGISYARARDLGLDTIEGVEISSLTAGGAAQEQGLQRNDVILSVDGESVNESNELQEKIAVHRPGDEVTLKIWRDDNIIRQRIKLGRVSSADRMLANDQNEFPDNYDERSVRFGTFSLGFKAMQLASKDDSTASDLIIARVYSSTEADRQGLKEGYIIKKIDNRSVSTLAELRRIIGSYEKGDSFVMKVEDTEGATKFFDLKK